MKSTRISIVGKDARFAFLAEYLEKEGLLVTMYPEWKETCLKDCDLLIGPEDFYKDGILRPEINYTCATYHVPIFNYLSSREYAIANAEFIAEGLLAYLILNTPFSLNGSTALVLGFDRPGSAIAKRLHVLGCRVDAYDLIPETLENPESYNFIINTHPSMILTKKHLETLCKDCILFDLSSTHCGYDEDTVTRLGLKLVHCPNIAEYTAPKSAGYMMGALALNYLN